MFTITFFWSDIVAVAVAAAAFAVAIVVDRKVSDGEARTASGFFLGAAAGLVGLAGILVPTLSGRSIAAGGIGMASLAAAIVIAAAATRRRDCLAVMSFVSASILGYLAVVSVIGSLLY